MFAYNFSIILVGILTFMSTFCESLFAFTIFSMAFGGLLGENAFLKPKTNLSKINFSFFFFLIIGFNFSLRSAYLYDIIGLDWNDDSLFSVITLGQSITVLIGLPLTGMIFIKEDTVD